MLTFQIHLYLGASFKMGRSISYLMFRFIKHEVKVIYVMVLISGPPEDFSELVCSVLLSSK